MSSLKDLYENPDLVEDSEEDSDFVPNDSESDDQDIEESEDEQEIMNETDETSTKEKEEDATSKKSRIDAIWNDMNKEPAKKITETKAEKEIVEEVKVTEKRKLKADVTQNKRPKSNLNSLISKYNIKEPKLNTLEKSKLDWQGFVKKEGIEDELKYKNKDGYMEKVAFLNRVDDRRLNQLKEGQNSKK